MILMTFVLLAVTLVVFGSATIATGVLLGVLTILGFIAITIRMPFIASFAKKVPILFEIGGAVCTYLVLGQSVTGLIAAAVVGLGLSALIGYQVDAQPQTEEQETSS